MIKGIGVDIVDLRRIKRNLDKLALKILSKEEKELFDQLMSEKRKVEFLGGRFAFKEAYFKAIKQGFAYQEISLLINDDGSPKLLNHNDLVHISITHENTYVVAMVVIEE